jgi:hypothetical protein
MKAINASGKFEIRHACGNSRKEYTATRKADAVGSKNFIRSRVINGGWLCDYNKSKMRKKSKLAAKRARAMNPQLEKLGRERQCKGIIYTLIKMLICIINYCLFLFKSFLCQNTSCSIFLTYQIVSIFQFTKYDFI